MEKNLQKEIVDYLRDLGHFVHALTPPYFKRMVYGVVYDLPDIYDVDLHLYIEIKDKEYKKAHKDHQLKQDMVREELKNHGARVCKVASLEELKDILFLYE